jgi:pyridoxine 5-phosphate synthase
MKLGVNIDHIATVREARKTFEPDPVLGAKEAVKGGADGIVFHLRKDRRHIQDADLALLKRSVKKHLNMEMSVDEEIVRIALKLSPDQATLVPENRQEITTEGGLDVVSGYERIREVASRLKARGIAVSFFIDADKEQVDASFDAGADMVEFHTGRFAEAFNSGGSYGKEIKKLKGMTERALSLGLIAAAGHGLTYRNVKHVARIKGITELNIGHSIISRAVFSGMRSAVREMKGLIR